MIDKDQNQVLYKKDPRERKKIIILVKKKIKIKYRKQTV